MQSSKDEISVSSGENSFLLTARAQLIGRDILVSISGGTSPHIGSVVVSTPRKSLKNREKTSSTSSVVNIEGHKDEAIARMFSEKIASVFFRTTVAAAGFHIDNLNAEDIENVMSNAEKLCSKIIKILKRKSY